MKSERAAGDDEVTFLADFEFVIACGEILENEAAGSVGFGSEEMPGAVFELELGGGHRDIVFVHNKTGASG